MAELLSYEDVVITEALRIPIGKFGGTLKGFECYELGALSIKALLERTEIDPELIDEVLMSHTRQDGTGTNPARNMALFGGVAIKAPAQTVNMVCPAGLKAQHIASLGIRTGETQVAVVGGSESMSNIPHLLRGARWQGFRLMNITIDDGFLYLTDKYSNIGPGQTAEYCAEKWGFTREEQEQLGVESHQKAAKAWAEGVFTREIAPVTIPEKKGKAGHPEYVFEKDECFRENATLESMLKLPTPFKKNGTVSAGSSAGITDGSGAMLMMSRKKAEELGMKPMLHFVDFMFAGVEPKDFLEGPSAVIPQILERNNLTIDDMKYVEVNEAFAPAILTVEKEMGWKDREKLNPHGGGIALGHPTGYSGIRLTVHLANVLKKGEYGLACLCGGGGMAGAAIVQSERGD